MEARVHLLAEQLLLIERELRLLGWWESQAPSAAALASQEPFCVDTLSFEQWLQWIFLPRMAFLLEQGAALPETSGIHAMGEMTFASRAAEARTLQGLLGEFDRLLQVRL